MLRLLVSSFGGVGSKCLVKGLLQTADEKILNQAHTHLRLPPGKDVLDGRKMIYMFGDPYNAVVSFFNRRKMRTRAHGFDGRGGGGDPFWVVKHCRNIGGKHAAMNPNWELMDYLKNGVDLLEIEQHFDNWVQARTEYPILFLRYETMWDHLQDIYNFVGLPQSDIARFPAQQPRGSSWQEQPESLKLGLAKMCGALHKRIMNAADVWIAGNTVRPHDDAMATSAQPRL